MEGAALIFQYSSLQMCLKEAASAADNLSDAQCRRASPLVSVPQPAWPPAGGGSVELLNGHFHFWRLFCGFPKEINV